MSIDDFLIYEACFPGSITGETEVECPYCKRLLTVAVDDPMGEEKYQCCNCGCIFEVNWGEGQVRYDSK